MNIVVNMKDKSVQIMAGEQTVIEPKYVYMVGNNAGWGTAQWAGAEDGSVNYAVTLGTPAPTVAGEGCFEVPDVGGHKLTVTLNSIDNTVLFATE